MSARLLKDPNTANCRIFVGHLQTDDMTKMDLEQHFSKYGTVIGALMNRGFGFVQFENEGSVHAAIQHEDGQMFKGRRIDVKPAKKDRESTGGDKSKTSGRPDSQFSPRGNQQRNNSFSGSNSSGNNQNYSNNQSFNSSNQSANPPAQNQSNSSNFEKQPPKPMETSQPQETFKETLSNQEEPENDDNYTGNSQTDSFNNNQENEDDSFDQQNQSQNRSSNDQITEETPVDTASNSQTNNSNQNRGNSAQNRPGNNQNQSKNQNNQNQGNSNQNQNNNNNQSRTRGSRGGKNRNKNRDNAGNNYRDRSPINRGNRGIDEKQREWEMNKMRNSALGPRDSYEQARFDDRYRDMMPGPNYRPMVPPDYPQVEKNDCEIIVVHKSLTEYAEAIEARLKKMGLTVDLLFPNEDVPLSRVLGNIANRGCLYAVVVIPINQEHHSLTLNILHGLPQEHRNMPVEDALNLINRDFSNYKSGGRGVPLNTPFSSDRHPDAIQVLLNMLADNHQLTVLQYDRLIKYLEIKREEQVQVELGDAKDLPSTALTVSDPKQAELQSRILNILNSNKPGTSVPAPSPVPAPAPVPPATWAAAATTASASSASSGVTPSPLLNDPTVQKALDSLLQGNLLKSIGDPQSASASSAQPLFAAFPNINRF